MQQPLTQQQVRASVPSGRALRPADTGPHVFYGTIAALRGTLITLRLRSARSLQIDTSSAIANGYFSAPLFVGKLVSIDGEFHGTTFTAAHITRLTNLAALRSDR